jgi:hypothetical protein
MRKSVRTKWWGDNHLRTAPQPHGAEGLVGVRGERNEARQTVECLRYAEGVHHGRVRVRATGRPSQALVQKYVPQPHPRPAIWGHVEKFVEKRQLLSSKSATNLRCLSFRDISYLAPRPRAAWSPKGRKERKPFDSCGDEPLSTRSAVGAVI